MAPQTYDDLIHAVVDLAEEIDESLPLARFVGLAEVELNTILNHYLMEDEVTLTTAGNAVELPSDFIQARLIEVDGKIARRVSAHGATLASGEIGYYLVGNKYRLVPAKAEPRIVRLIYTKRLPALTQANETNWLLSKFPDVYINAVLVQGYRYRDNERLGAVAQANLDKAIALVMEDHRRATIEGNPIMFEDGSIC